MVHRLEAQIQQSEAKIEQSRSLQIQVAKSAAYTTAKPQKKLSIISEFIYTNASPEMPEIRLNLDRVYHELVRLELERDKINQQKNIISARESEQWNAIFTNQSKDDYDRVLNRRAELRTQLDYLNAEFNTNWQKLNKIEDEARWICNIFESTASEAAAQNIKSVDIKPKTSPKPIRK